MKDTNIWNGFLSLKQENHMFVRVEGDKQSVGRNAFVDDSEYIFAHQCLHDCSITSFTCDIANIEQMWGFFFKFPKAPPGTLSAVHVHVCRLSVDNFIEMISYVC